MSETTTGRCPPDKPCACRIWKVPCLDLFSTPRGKCSNKTLTLLDLIIFSLQWGSRKDKMTTDTDKKPCITVNHTKHWSSNHLVCLGMRQWVWPLSPWHQILIQPLVKPSTAYQIGASISASKLSNSLAFLESNRLAAQHNDVVHNNREQWIKLSRLPSQKVKPQIQWDHKMTQIIFVTSQELTTCVILLNKKHVSLLKSLLQHK